MKFVGGTQAGQAWKSAAQRRIAGACAVFGAVVALATPIVATLVSTGRLDFSFSAALLQNLWPLQVLGALAGGIGAFFLLADRSNPALSGALLGIGAGLVAPFPLLFTFDPGGIHRLLVTGGLSIVFASLIGAIANTNTNDNSPHDSPSIQPAPANSAPGASLAPRQSLAASLALAAGSLAAVGVLVRNGGVLPVASHAYAWVTPLLAAGIGLGLLSRRMDSEYLGWASLGVSASCFAGSVLGLTTPDPETAIVVWFASAGLLSLASGVLALKRGGRFGGPPES